MVLVAERSAGFRAWTTRAVASAVLPSLLARALAACCIGLSASSVDRQSDQERGREGQGNHGLDIHDANLMPDHVVNALF